MFKMILADDETVITRGLCSLIDWKALGIEILCCCSDGTSALKEIMVHRPHIAILDISMPGMAGIEVLREINAAGGNTKVIFVSGFQDFSYARDALSYGAVDYLLKPVKKDSLIEAVSKCLPVIRPATKVEPELAASVYNIPIEVKATDFQLAKLVNLSLEGKNELEQQLIQFSLFSQVEKFFQESKNCTAFQKKNEIYIIFSESSQQNNEHILRQLRDKVCKSNQWEIGFILSEKTSQMADIPTLTQKCNELCSYFYFWEYLPTKILTIWTPVFEITDFSQARKMQIEIAQAFIKQDDTKVQTLLQEYFQLCAYLADGKKDVCIYYILNCLQEILDYTSEYQLSENISVNIDSMLSVFRELPSYHALTEAFLKTIQQLTEQVAAYLRKNDKKEILMAIEYINQHYAENITLDVLAKYVHMNSFYFSSYLKKQTGQNFKDYLAKTRMRHAVELLVGSDLKNYEIAERVGFKDYRTFSELFQRFYEKTPTTYKKSLKQNADE